VERCALIAFIHHQLFIWLLMVLYQPQKLYQIICEDNCEFKHPGSAPERNQDIMVGIDLLYVLKGHNTVCWHYHAARVGRVGECSQGVLLP
jgi:hypothetical protein